MKLSISILSILIVLFFIGCKKKDAQDLDSNTNNNTNTLPTTKTYKVTSEGATISDTATGVTIEIPDGATTSDFNLSIKEIDTTTTALEFIGGKSFPGVGKEYKIIKSSESLLSYPATVSLPYDPEKVSNNEALTVAYYSEILNKWIPVDIESVDTVLHKVVFYTIHFSIWAVVKQTIFGNSDPSSFTSFNTGYLPNVDGFGILNYPFPSDLQSDCELTGNCWGFTTLSLIYYFLHKDLPKSQRLFAMTYKGSDEPTDPRNLPIVKAVHQAQNQLCGFITKLNVKINGGDALYNPYSIGSRSAAFSIYDKMKTTGLPVCVSLNNKDLSDGHEIIVYKYEKEKNGSGRFYYYNPNVSVENLAAGDSLYFTNNADGTINTFEYIGSSNPIYHEYVQYISPSYAKGGGLSIKYAESLFQQYFTGQTITNPEVYTDSIISKADSSGGVILYDGGSSITARGVCWSTSKDPTINDYKTIDGSGDGSFTSKLTNLKPNTTYYVRSYATNSNGTGYGKEFSFTTSKDNPQSVSPTVTTKTITNITSTTAISGGNVTYNGGTSIKARGVCWSTSKDPTINDYKTNDGSGDGLFTSKLTNIERNTTYYVRAYATNDYGTGYGGEVSFTTAKGDSSSHNKDFYLGDNGVTVSCPLANFGDTGIVNGITYTKRQANQITVANASTTCTSGITDMQNLFYGNLNGGNWKFNGDISSWDVSNVTNMNEMFMGDAHFNQDIGSWDVSKVTDMSYMFDGDTLFNQDIGKWNVSNVRSMFVMFDDAKAFNQDIGNWNVSNVANMSVMFADAASFNQDIGKWDVSNVTDMSGMFSDAASFNQDIGDWDVSNVTDMPGMFREAISFNQNIGKWDVSNVRDMSYMFDDETSFNQDIGKWKVGNVTNMSSMFYNANSFNQGLSDWCVQNIPKEPDGFSIGCPLINARKPVWGTCPK
ncbi:MAG: BspA family leucine-rich repeat surface protein [Ferruginibacter sp.]